MLSPWLNARKYEWSALRALRGATSDWQNAWLKMGRRGQSNFRLLGLKVDIGRLLLTKSNDERSYPLLKFDHIAA